MDRTPTEVVVGMVVRTMFEEMDTPPDVGVMLEAEWEGRQRVAEDMVMGKEWYLCRVMLVGGLLVYMLIVLAWEHFQKKIQRGNLWGESGGLGQVWFVAGLVEVEGTVCHPHSKSGALVLIAARAPRWVDVEVAVRVEDRESWTVRPAPVLKVSFSPHLLCLRTLDAGWFVSVSST